MTLTAFIFAYFANKTIIAAKININIEVCKYFSKKTFFSESNKQAQQQNHKNTMLFSQ